MRVRVGLIATLVLLVVAVAGAWLALRQGAPEKSPTAREVTVSDLRVRVALDEATVGERKLDVMVTDLGGAPVEVQGVEARFHMPQMPATLCILPTDARLTGLSTGHFQARGGFFTMAGEWAGELTITRGSAAPVIASVVFSVADPQMPASAPKGLTLSPLGATLYVNNCAICHGETGRGDGPAAAGLSPPPADFSQHMQPGLHGDPQIFRWIQGGFPGSAMPAWDDRLSDEEIWQLVAYLRTFASASPAASDVASDAAGLALPLVFARDDSLWQSDGRGATPVRLAPLPEGVIPYEPAVSPDGKRIAFSGSSVVALTPSITMVRSTLYVINRDGSGLRELWTPEQGTLRRPTWTVDGSALYVATSGVTFADGVGAAVLSQDLMRVDLASGAATRVREQVLDLGIAPDGRLALVQQNPETFQTTLALLTADTAAPTTLVDRQEFMALASPRFAPDGNSLLFVATGGPPTDEQGYPQSQGRVEPLDVVLGLFAPSVAEAHGPPWGLWTVKSDGSGLRKLGGFSEDEPMARFTPDGSAIVAMGAGGIYHITLPEGAVTRIDPRGGYGGLDWLTPRSGDG